MLVRVAEAIGDLPGDVDRLDRGDVGLQHPGAQLDALEELHRGVREIALLAEVVHRDDVGMGELAGGLRLLEEPLVVFLAPFGVVGEEDGLERDGAIERRVLRLVDDSHRAAAELSADLVAAEPRQFLFCHGTGVEQVAQGFLDPRRRVAVFSGDAVENLLMPFGGDPDRDTGSGQRDRRRDGERDKAPPPARRLPRVRAEQLVSPEPRIVEGTRREHAGLVPRGGVGHRVAEGSRDQKARGRGEIGDARRDRDAVTDHPVVGPAACHLHCAVIDSDAQRQPGRVRGEAPFGDAQCTCRISENRDGDPVRGVEHDPARDRKLRGGDRDDRLELCAKAGLLGDRPAREILDFQKDDARVARGRVRCCHWEA